MKDLPASHPLYGSEQSKSGFGICYQFAIKCPVSVPKAQCFQGFAGFVSYSHSLPPGYFARFFMVFAIETLVFTPNNPPVILFIRLRGCTESRNETSCNRKG